MANIEIKNLTVDLEQAGDQAVALRNGQLFLSEKKALGTAADANIGTAGTTIPTNNTVDSKISTQINDVDNKINTLSADLGGDVLQGKGAMLVNGSVIQVSTIADLRALEPAFDGQQVELLGHTVAGFGGGVFYADYSSTAADDNGVAIVTTGGKRWIRKLDGFVTPTMFGALGDGVTDDSAAVQQCLNEAAISGKSVHLEGYRYLCNGQIVVPSNSSIFGPGKFIAGPASAFPASPQLGFFLALEKDNVSIELVSFDISAWTSLPAGVASLRSVLFKRSNEIRINNCNFLTTGGGPAFIGCKGITVTENKIVSFPVGGVDNGFADGMIDIWTEYDIDASRCVVANNIIQGQGFGRWGIMLTGLTFEAQVMQVDSVTVTGNVIENTYYDGIWAFGRNGGFFGAAITGNTIGGARKGISISDCSGISVTGNSIRNTRSHGLHLWTETSAGGTLGATGCTITGNVLKDVAQVGASTPAIWLDGTSSKNTVSGNTVIGTTHHLGLVVGAGALYNEIGVNAIEKGAGPKYNFFNTKTKYLGNIFTPTVAGTNNVTEATLLSAYASIAGDTATVYFRISVTPTTGGQFTRATITLPYDSDVTTYSLFGGASQNNGENAFITDDAVGDRAYLQFTPSSDAKRDITGWFSYRILS